MQSVKNDEKEITNNTGPTGLAAASKETESDKADDKTPAEVDKKDEEETTETQFEEPVNEEVTVYGVYTEKGALVKKFNSVNHGKDFIKLATAFAARNKMVAKPYVEPRTPEELETDVVHVVTSNNQPVRTFSLVTHGKNYEKLAKQFVEKYGEKKGYKVKK